MARPPKKAIDYFPLDCSLDDSIKFIEAKHGMAGFGVLIKLWSKIYSSEGYYCRWDEKTKYLFCKETGVGIEDIEAILATCLTEGVFSKPLFHSHQVLTSSGIQRRYFKIVKEAKRKEIQINPEIYLLELNSGDNAINSGGNPQNSGNTPVENPQRKVKKNKEQKSKVLQKRNIDSKEKDDKEPIEVIEIPTEQPSNGLIEKEKSSGKKEKVIVLNNRNEPTKPKQNSSKDKFGRHPTDDLAKRAFTFGR